jgi:hypothetical protein
MDHTGIEAADMLWPGAERCCNKTDQRVLDCRYSLGLLAQGTNERQAIEDARHRKAVARRLIVRAKQNETLARYQAGSHERHLDAPDARGPCLYLTRASPSILGYDHDLDESIIRLLSDTQHFGQREVEEC